jgi:lipoate-protein ligase A
MKFRFIDSPKLSAKANMDFDKSLVENFDGTPIFRLYSWEENSFTIGRFQKLEEIQNIQKFGTNYARRMTGGGLLLHGFDVSYSLVIPITLLGNKSVKESYEYICSFILDFYKKIGLHVEYAKDIDISLSKSFFCQDGFEAYDMITQGKKIGGNAQRRTKELIFQHGSIPLRSDQREFSGHSLDEFGINLNEKEVKELLLKSFKEIFSIKLDNIQLKDF